MFVYVHAACIHERTQKYSSDSHLNCGMFQPSLSMPATRRSDVTCCKPCERKDLYKCTHEHPHIVCVHPV